MKIIKRYEEAYKYGKELVETYPGISFKNISEIELRSENENKIEAIFNDEVAREFLMEGFLGQEIPKWVRGYRRGEIPEGGRSYNYRDQEKHAGTSVLGISGENESEEFANMPREIHELFISDREIIIIEGWKLSRKGADGEPLLAAPIKIQKGGK